ncbi:MAG: hypothetical protein GX786_10190 [Clostridiales bacterium]|nr:hypothetical protein [Clostridiales bacterium]
MTATLQSVQQEYEKALMRSSPSRATLTAEAMIQLAFHLFEKINILDPQGNHVDDDLLLFQYGVEDLFDGNGLCFYLDLTRQFYYKQDQEPYQLSFTLFFDPSAFDKEPPCLLWSDTYNSLYDFSLKIKDSPGYQKAARLSPRSYELHCGQC